MAEPSRVDAALARAVVRNVPPRAGAIAALGEGRSAARLTGLRAPFGASDEEG